MGLGTVPRTTAWVNWSAAWSREGSILQVPRTAARSACCRPLLALLASAPASASASAAAPVPAAVCVHSNCTSAAVMPPSTACVTSIPSWTPRSAKSCCASVSRAVVSGHAARMRVHHLSGEAVSAVCVSGHQNHSTGDGVQGGHSVEPHIRRTRFVGGNSRNWPPRTAAVFGGPAASCGNNWRWVCWVTVRAA